MNYYSLYTLFKWSAWIRMVIFDLYLNWRLVVNTKIEFLLNKISMVDMEEKIKSAKRLQKTLRRLIDEKLNPLLYDYN